MAPAGTDENLGNVIDTPAQPLTAGDPVATSIGSAPITEPEEPDKMDPFTVASIALGLGTLLFKQAEELGIIEGDPAWAQYVLAGLSISQQALTIIKDMKDNVRTYKDWTPQQILEALMPTGLPELELRARQDLGLEPA